MDQDTDKTNDNESQTIGQDHDNDNGVSEKPKIAFGRFPGNNNDNTQEEMAEEMTPDDFHKSENVGEGQDDNETIAPAAIGWIGLALSVLSFIMIPIIFGGAGIIMGFAAKTRDTEILGNSAIITGAASIVITMFIAPFI